VRMDSPSEKRFVTRVERELRRRRDHAVDRCRTCGKTVSRSEDYVQARGGVVHASCATPSLFVKDA
jgi:hypothetical protein